MDSAFLLGEDAERPVRLPATAGEASHGEALSTVSLCFERPFTQAALTEALGTLSRLRGADLLRAKGLVAVAGCRGPVVVQGVRHHWHPPVELKAWPDSDRRSRMVFIGSRLRPEPITRLFEAIIELGNSEAQP